MNMNIGGSYVTDIKHSESYGWPKTGQGTGVKPHYKASMHFSEPRGVRRRSAGARLLGLRVRNPLGASMTVSCECCVLSGRELSASG